MVAAESSPAGKRSHTARAHDPGVRVVALAAVLLLSSITLASGAAAPHTFLVSAPATGGLDVSVTDSDGSGRISLTGGLGLAYDPAWSPDGEHVVYASNRDGSDVDPSDLYVVAADGTSLRRVTTDAAVIGSHSDPQWSPDGSTIAYVAGGTDVWTVPAGGGPSSRLTVGAGQARGLAWSPDSSRLLFTDSTGPAAVEVLDVRTGLVVARVQGADAAWSPDGRRIAYVDGVGRAAVMSSDGTGSAELTELPSSGPVWSPDGGRVVYAARVTDTSVPPSRFGYPTRTDLYASPPDGSAPAVRLTGPFDLHVLGATAQLPSYSPDGTQILYRADGRVVQMNADGTCPRRLPGLDDVSEGPYWRPGVAAGAPLACVDLQVRASVEPAQAALGRVAVAHVTVENHGNRPAPDVEIVAAPDEPATSVVACSFGCGLGTLPPGASASVDVSFRSTTPGNHGFSFHATSSEPQLVPSDATGIAETTVLPCTIVGTWGADRLQGTKHRDRICALPGPDLVLGGAGDDYLDAGSGNDTIFGGPGHDTILGRGGRDVIFARDGVRDWIDCGTEYDTVVADRYDHVHRNCEHVLRG
jgi:Tol biopolymer transport system component